MNAIKINRSVSSPNFTFVLPQSFTLQNTQQPHFASLTNISSYQLTPTTSLFYNKHQTIKEVKRKEKQVFSEPYDEQNSSPAPDVRIGQRVAYREYYGDEFGTVRWIGRVPQICADWTLGVEFDNAIGEGDGSLHGRRYFIAKDCFAKFLPLANLRLVDEHVGRPEPGTMISVMSAAVQPGQMISIQRVSTVHVQHCFLNAPHRLPGDYLLAVNTRLHCQCPSCGPCAHVVVPSRVQRLGPSKNATHMCQFSHYSCCQLDSVNTGSSCDLMSSNGYVIADSPLIANSWIAGAGYLSQLSEHQSKLIPEDYYLGLGPHDDPARLSRSSSHKLSKREHHKKRNNKHNNNTTYNNYNNINIEINNSDLTPQADCFQLTQTTPNKRDSIENRYLFPSDESDLFIARSSLDSTTIDSSHLHHLSKARYGTFTQSTNNNNNSSGILRSLKSLVSCLSIARHEPSIGQQRQVASQSVGKRSKQCHNSSQSLTNQSHGELSYASSDGGISLTSHLSRKLNVNSNDEPLVVEFCRQLVDRLAVASDSKSELLNNCNNQNGETNNSKQIELKLTLSIDSAIKNRCASPPIYATIDKPGNTFAKQTNDLLA